ncbi:MULTISPECIES: Uma2 family endonuclease [Methylobacterium]|nr:MULTISPECIES: Uma2 family endonuclease [Methylobacterium]TXN23622.1 Uma2 family endonuclease [Methylobacterium sp. WL9]
MLEPAPQPMSVAAFFAWQERQAERYELVGGVPVRMMAGARNVHDDIVVNLVAALHTALRGSGCRPFTGDGSVETLPGQIRRPDVGVDCGARDPSGLKAAAPRLVAEVLSPSTRDFDAFEKLGEYKTLDSLAHILLIEPNAAEVMLWSRDDERAWIKQRIVGLGASAELPALRITLALADLYDGVAFPARPRLVQDETPGGAAG